MGTRSVAVSLAWLCTLAVGCRPGPAEPLGPADSFVVLARVGASDPPVFARADPTSPQVAPLQRALLDGFGAETVRTAYMVKQFLARGTVNGQPFDARARQIGGDALALVLGYERPASDSIGMRIEGAWLGGPVERPDAMWIGLPADPSSDDALVQTATGALARFIGHVAVSGGRPGADAVTCARRSGSPQVLADGYAMAMEVIAREWRTGEGTGGRLSTRAGTTAQRELFARVRENSVVNGKNGQPASPGDVTTNPEITASVFYRLLQNRKLSQAVAAPEFYRPFAGEQIPAGMNPALVLGSFRNLQAKLLIPWIEAAHTGQGPCDIVDLVALYAARFPAEKEELLRIFVVTTLGLTLVEGGIVALASNPVAALKVADELVTDVVTGRRTLRAMLNETP